MRAESESTQQALDYLAQDWPSIETSIDERGITLTHRELGFSYYHSLISGSLAQRASQPGQAIVRACNNKSRNIHRVLDLTAGWGGDGLTLARQGQSVTWLECNPLVHAILEYSLLELKADPDSSEFAARLQLESGHALEYLQALPARHDFDCIFLDPMFPAHKSGAKPGKDLQILQTLTENRDIDACFEQALQKANKRVVVKRPLKATGLAKSRPDICYREKAIRFDVYLTS